MAPQPQTEETRSPRRAPARRGSARGANGRRRRHTGVRATRRSDVGELEQVIRDLEQQIAHLTSREGIRSTVSGATNQVSKAVTTASNHLGDMAADMLTDVAQRLRGSANSVTSVARTGASAVQRIGVELERRPMMSVAIALGIGFLAGLAGRKNEAA